MQILQHQRQEMHGRPWDAYTKTEKEGSRNYKGREKKENKLFLEIASACETNVAAAAEYNHRVWPAATDMKAPTLSLA